MAVCWWIHVLIWSRAFRFSCAICHNLVAMITVFQHAILKKSERCNPRNILKFKNCWLQRLQQISTISFFVVVGHMCISMYNGTESIIFRRWDFCFRFTPLSFKGEIIAGSKSRWIFSLDNCRIFMNIRWSFCMTTSFGSGILRHSSFLGRLVHFLTSYQIVILVNTHLQTEKSLK